MYVLLYFCYVWYVVFVGIDEVGYFYCVDGGDGWDIGIVGVVQQYGYGYGLEVWVVS